jgi:hypothetical protein
MDPVKNDFSTSCRSSYDIPPWWKAIPTEARTTW